MLIQKQYNKLILLAQQAMFFFIIKEVKETVLDFSQRTVKFLCFYFML